MGLQGFAGGGEQAKASRLCRGRTATQIPGEALRSRLAGFGVSDAMAQAMIDTMDAKNAGLDDGQARSPEFPTPTSFRQWCEEVLRPAVQA